VIEDEDPSRILNSVSEDLYQSPMHSDEELEHDEEEERKETEDENPELMLNQFNGASDEPPDPIVPTHLLRSTTLPLASNPNLNPNNGAGTISTESYSPSLCPPQEPTALILPVLPKCAQATHRAPSFFLSQLPCNDDA
jgi:hypothetical protein